MKAWERRIRRIPLYAESCRDGWKPIWSAPTESLLVPHESRTRRSSTSHARRRPVDRRWDEGMVEGEHFSLWRDDLFLDFSLNFLWLPVNADDLRSQRSLCLSFFSQKIFFFLHLHNFYEDISLLDVSPPKFFSRLYLKIILQKII